MARETKTVQCYPDDDIVNERIRQYEAFGWELINNQRCQEFDGQSSEMAFDGSTTTVNHYSTFNKLTFSREKNSPWYGEVTALEANYNRLLDEKPSRPYERKIKGVLIFLGVLLTIFAIPFVVIGIINGIIFLPLAGVALLAGALAMFITQGMKKKKNRIDYDLYLTMKSAWEKNQGVEAEKILEKAQSIVDNG